MVTSTGRGVGGCVFTLDTLPSLRKYRHIYSTTETVSHVCVQSVLMVKDPVK